MRDPYEQDILTRETHERHLTWIVVLALMVALCVVVAVLVTWVRAAA